MNVVDNWKKQHAHLSQKYYGLFQIPTAKGTIDYIQCWNKLKEYLNKQKENFKKMLPTGYASNEMLGKLWFAENILKTMNKLEKGINI